MQKVYIGIDPQPDNISYCVISDKNIPVLWTKHLLMLRCTFATANSWQRYIYLQCLRIGVDIREYCKSYNYTIVIVGVEQQRGRVNSLIEQSLLNIFWSMGLEARSVHPRQWKKSCELSNIGDNKAHKVASTKMAMQELEEYWKRTQSPKVTGRLHDLADAYHISKHVLKDS